MTKLAEEAEALVAAATPGPWRVAADQQGVETANGIVAIFAAHDFIVAEKEDLALCARAPTLLALLAAENRRLSALIREADVLLNPLTETDSVKQWRRRAVPEVW